LTYLPLLGIVTAQPKGIAMSYSTEWLEVMNLLDELFQKKKEIDAKYEAALKQREELLRGQVFKKVKE